MYDYPERELNPPEPDNWMAELNHRDNEADGYVTFLKAQGEWFPDEDEEGESE